MTDSAINILTDLQALNPEVFRRSAEYIQALLTEQFPDRDFGVGRGLYWMVVVPAAAAAAAQLANARLTSDSLNLGAARANPERVNDEMADLLLSNYYVERRAGARSTGTLALTVSQLTTYVISIGQIFTVGDQQYRTTTTVFAYPTANQLQGPSDRLLGPQADGTWAFTVPVEAVELGANTYQPRGALLTMQSPPPGYVRARSATDISGGLDEQNLQDLLAQIPAKFAASTWGSRNNVRALIAQFYPQANSWVTGFGDPEMLRDRHNPMAIASGGFSDVWVSTSNSLLQESRVLSATLVHKQERRWRLVLGRQEASGVYTLTDVRRPGGDPLTLLSVDRGFVQDHQPGAPLLFNELEAAYSAYQTLTLEFVDHAQDLPDVQEGDEREYEVGVLGMSDIHNLSQQMIAGQYLNPVANVLVRAVVPCRVSISMSIRLLDSDFESGINLQAMREAMISRVSNIALGYGVLSSSILLDAVHDFLSGRSDVGGTTVTLRGDILAPNGDLLSFDDGREIRIPDRPGMQVTPNTTKFFTDNSLIDIEFQRVDI